MEGKDLPEQASEKMSGIVLDDNALITLVQEVDEIRSIETGKTGVSGDPAEKYREIAEEMLENLERMSVPGLSVLTERLIGDMEEYDNEGASDDLPVCMQEIADLLESTVDECGDMSAKRRRQDMEDDDETVMLIAGQPVSLNIGFYLPSSMRLHEVSSLLEKAVSRVRGFVVKGGTYRFSIPGEPHYDEEVEAYIGESDMLYSEYDGLQIRYEFRLDVQANSDVPLSGVADVLETSIDDIGFECDCVGVKSGKTAVLGRDIQIGQLFTADREVVESQKQALLEAQDAAPDGKHVYDVSIRLYIENTSPDKQSKEMAIEASEIEDSWEYLSGVAKWELAGRPSHEEVTRMWDAGSGLWRTERKEVRDGFIPFFAFSDGMERYYESRARVTCKETEEDVVRLVENAVDMDCDPAVVVRYDIIVNGNVYTVAEYDRDPRMEGARNAVWEWLEPRLAGALPYNVSGDIVYALCDYIIYFCMDTWEYRNEGCRITAENISRGMSEAIQDLVNGNYKETMKLYESKASDPAWFMPER